MPEDKYDGVPADTQAPVNANPQRVSWAIVRDKILGPCVPPAARTVNCPPTWTAAANAHINCLLKGTNPKAMHGAQEELLRMARLLDEAQNRG